MDDLIRAMKAAGEPTRMRILLLLHGSELTVSELCRILGQSQPRVSRHLKLLCDAGLLHRQAEGTSAYYRYDRSTFAQEFLAAMHPLADVDCHQAQADQRSLSTVRADRAELAARSSARIQAEDELLASRRAPKVDVEAAMLAAVADLTVERLLDIGTGTGRILQLFAPRISSGVGIETSREMLNLARTRLDAEGLDHCRVRNGNAYNLDAPEGSISLAVLHHVLHFLDEPARAVEQAARTLEPGGRLLIVDFAPHDVEALRSDHGHRRLGFTDDEVTGWCTAAGLARVEVAHLAPQDPVAGSLTITMWQANQPGRPRSAPDARPAHKLEPVG